ncbi:hypothetical protein BDP27DRAFT_1374501 [Rhodocollybia butyracea]|uniref:Uncharacterized protein n=1 Tax=Rhodocollybia butyracea TaxID=206335 RepID=A0A9P5P640_9AGAR|nr:hypothetical protein BDP27DRAFT_1374501 [Rhodocollybia butyracea]
MSSSPDNTEIVAEILTQDILPKAPSLILWILVFTTVTVTILQRVFLFPCVTLSSLRRTVDAVDDLLKGHEAGIHTMHTSVVSDTVSVDASIINKAGFRSTGLLVESMSKIEIHPGLYISPPPVMRALQDNIEHSIALSSKQHNDWKLDSNATQLRRRNISNSQSSVQSVSYHTVASGLGTDHFTKSVSGGPHDLHVWPPMLIARSEENRLSTFGQMSILTHQ